MARSSSRTLCVPAPGFSRRSNNAMNSPGAKHRVKKACAIWIDLWYSSGFMIHLVNLLQKESFSGSVVTLQCKHLADHSASRTALGMDDEFDGFSNLCFAIRECRLGGRRHH